MHLIIISFNYQKVLSQFKRFKNNLYPETFSNYFDGE